jgi:hypothetical protein
MRAVVVAVLVARSALAQPPGDPDAAFEACKTRRRALTREAMKIADVNERGRALARMPICLRLEDSSTEIIGFVPTPPEPRRVHVSGELELAAGGAYHAMTSDLGSFVAHGTALELAAGARIGDNVAVLGFASYAAADANFLYINDLGTRQAPFTAHEQLAIGGAKLRIHVGRFVVALGSGFERQHETGYSVLTGSVDLNKQLALLEADVGVTFARIGALDMRVLASGDLAGGVGVEQTIQSARLALGVSWRSRELAVAAP